MTLEIKAEEGRERYTAYLDGRPVGSAQWILVRDTVLVPYVRVAPEDHDKGIGSLLMRRIFDDARANQRTVLALCPFARRWTQLHPGYRDTARDPRWGERVAIRALLQAARTRRQLDGFLNPSAAAEGSNLSLPVSATGAAEVSKGGLA
jgi:predicted GNAT family acetyltransferase